MNIKLKSIEKDRYLKGIWGTGLEIRLTINTDYGSKYSGIFLTPTQRLFLFYISNINVESVLTAIENFQRNLVEDKWEECYKFGSIRWSLYMRSPTDTDVSYSFGFLNFLWF